jgi:very-short-patch-repair endonuclease
MPNYTTFPCSCIVCKQPKTSKGIHSHYLIAHTEEGKARNRKNRIAGGLLGSEIAKQNAQQIQNQYLENPNKCKQCDVSLTYEQRHNKFCSTSCSASFYNNGRKGVAISESVKQKISASVQKFNNKNPYPQYSKISFCCVCNSVIKNRIVKTCSSECKSALLSNNMTERIKQNRRSNYRRDKRSYLEESFETWLANNNISLKYETEYTIKNHITQKWYFVDFYFPEINLIVELDGKQHEKPKHKEADKLRDEYITTNLNLNVFRISYDEYQAGSKVNQLLKLFDATGGSTRIRTENLQGKSLML